jgi:hypothetical protein
MQRAKHVHHNLMFVIPGCNTGCWIQGTGNERKVRSIASTGVALLVRPLRSLLMG